MANVITDNRAVITAMNANTNIVDEAGAAYSSIQTEYFVHGTACTSDKFSMGSGGFGYDYTTPTDLTDVTTYIWWACASPGKLDTQAGGGVRIRFCGATVTDWFEIYIAGSDNYTGGFVMNVTDVVRARANAVAGTLGGVNGTTPAVSAIQYILVFFDVTGSVTGNTDNCFVDGMWSLAAATPGVIVEGRNAGTTDWTWDDIRDAADNNDATKAWGVFKDAGNGTYSCNTPIQFGVNDASTHGFTDTNVVVGWEDQLVATDFYGLTVLGGSSVQNFELGVVSGSGDDRVGSQGCIITAAPAGQRWFFDASDANIDVCNLYGCTFQHGDAFTLNDVNDTTISTTFLDCSSAVCGGSTFLNNSVIDAATADGVAFLAVADLGDIVGCSFIFSDGHAIECSANTVDPQTLASNVFTGYGADATNDAAIYYTYTGTLDVSVTGGAIPTKRDAGGATTTLSASYTFTITGIESGTEVRIFDASRNELAGIESSSTSFAYVHSGGEAITIRLWKLTHVMRTIALTLPSTASAEPANQRPDPDYAP